MNLTNMHKNQSQKEACFIECFSSLYPIKYWTYLHSINTMFTAVQKIKIAVQQNQLLTLKIKSIKCLNNEQNKMSDNTTTKINVADKINTSHFSKF